MRCTNVATDREHKDRQGSMVQLTIEHKGNYKGIKYVVMDIIYVRFFTLPYG